MIEKTDSLGELTEVGFAKSVALIGHLTALRKTSAKGTKKKAMEDRVRIPKSISKRGIKRAIVESADDLKFDQDFLHLIEDNVVNNLDKNVLSEQEER